MKNSKRVLLLLLLASAAGVEAGGDEYRSQEGRHELRRAVLEMRQAAMTQIHLDLQRSIREQPRPEMLPLSSQMRLAADIEPRHIH